jgi:hypothetical protein
MIATDAGRHVRLVKIRRRQSFWRSSLARFWVLYYNGVP